MGPLPEQFKVITKVIVVFTLLWSTTFSKAATDQNLFAGQYYLLELMTDVELYRKGQGQSDVYDQLTGHLQNFRTHFELLLATASLPESDALSLQQQWKQVARNLSALLVTIRQGGFIDQEIRYQYQEQTSQFWRQLHGAALGQRELTGPEQVVLHLQLANLRYLESQWRLAPHEESSLTAIAEQIDADVSELPNSPPDFRKKWPLLRQALLQEGGAMSFIVNRYSGDLIALLLEDIQSKGR